MEFPSVGPRSSVPVIPVSGNISATPVASVGSSALALRPNSAVSPIVVPTMHLRSKYSDVVISDNPSIVIDRSAQYVNFKGHHVSIVATLIQILWQYSILKGVDFRSTHIDHSVIQALIIKHGEHLEEIYLSDYSPVRELYREIAACKRLRTLYIERSNEPGNEGVIFLNRLLPCLRCQRCVHIIRSDTMVAKEVIITLAESCKHLVTENPILRQQFGYEHSMQMVNNSNRPLESSQIQHQPVVFRVPESSSTKRKTLLDE